MSAPRSLIALEPLELRALIRARDHFAAGEGDTDAETHAGIMSLLKRGAMYPEDVVEAME